jgi:hypothetical protein
MPTKKQAYFQPAEFAKLEPYTNEPLSKESKQFTLHAHVYGLHDSAPVTELTIPCGEGRQTVRWLGLVVAQKLGQASVGHGSRRVRGVRAGSNACVTSAFHLPSEVRAYNLETVEPTDILNLVFRQDGIVHVRMCSDFDQRWRSSLQLNRFRNPVLSNYFQESFQLSPSAKTNRQDPRNLRLFLKQPTDDGRKPSRATQEIGQCNEQDAKIERYYMEKQSNMFCVAMSRQLVFRNVFGGMTEEERLQEIRNVVDNEFEQVMQHVEDVDGVKDLFVTNFPDVNSIFKHYCAHTVSGSTGCMNFSEFCKAIHDCGFYHSVNDRALLITIFNESQPHFLEDKDNPDTELLRGEFMDSLIRVAQSKYEGVGTVKALEQTFAVMQIPSVVQNIEYPTVKAMKDRDIQAFLQCSEETIKHIFAHCKCYIGVFSRWCLF